MIKTFLFIASFQALFLSSTDVLIISIKLRSSSSVQFVLNPAKTRIFRTTSLGSNALELFAMVDGEPALVLDNIELKTKYQNNPKIRNAFVEYAKKLCEELGKPDMAIYAGPNRHKLDLSIFPKEERQMRPIGSTGKGEVYMDYTTGRRSVNGTDTESVVLYKIR